MIGNVWNGPATGILERETDAATPCCLAQNPRGGYEDASYDPRLPDIKIPRKVLKGGSHPARPTIVAATVPRRHAEPSTRRPVASDFAASLRKPHAS
jgi:hypothetical protein